VNPQNRPEYEKRMLAKVNSIVERCCCAERDEQKIDCFELMDLEDLMLEIAEAAYEGLLVQLDIRTIPRMPISEVDDFLRQIALRMIELSTENKLDEVWANTAAVTIVTRLWTIGEGLAVRHAKTRVTQYKSLPMGLINLFAEASKRRKIVSVWTTEVGPCELCAALGGALIDDIFENGPPAHPRCRCHLEHTVIE
jgi:hypothetical protein